jgi:uncharacterized protein YhfF
MQKSPASDAYFAAYCSARNMTGQDYDIVAFGDSAQMADELGALILHGPKRATAGLRRDFTEDDMPRIGGHVVVVDGRGAPTCIFQTTEVRVGPLSSVDDTFAWDEGEGDRSRAWWLQAHIDFFTRQAKREGFEFTPGIETNSAHVRPHKPAAQQPSPD